MEKFNIIDKGYCPFRIEKRDWQAGCVLRMGKTALCYTQDLRPLLRRNDAPNEYHCPLIKCSIPPLIEYLISFTPEETRLDSGSVAVNVT